MQMTSAPKHICSENPGLSSERLHLPWQVELFSRRNPRLDYLSIFARQGVLQQTNNARHMAKSVYSGISTTLMIVPQVM